MDRFSQIAFDNTVKLDGLTSRDLHGRVAKKFADIQMGNELRRRHPSAGYPAPDHHRECFPAAELSKFSSQVSVVLLICSVEL